MKLTYIKLFLDYLDAIESLAYSERGRLFTALLKYAKTGEVMELPGNERSAFLFMKAQLDRDMEAMENAEEKDEQTRQARRDAGSKGGSVAKAKSSKSKQTQANASKTKQKSPKDKDKDKDDNKDDNKDEEEKEYNLFGDCVDDCADDNSVVADKADGDTPESVFERLWALYPKKLGKGSVSKSQKERLFEAGEATVAKAIANYKAKIERDHTLEEYVLYGSTFFNTRWVDYLVDEQPKPFAEEYGYGYKGGRVSATGVYARPEDVPPGESF